MWRWEIALTHHVVAKAAKVFTARARLEVGDTSRCIDRHYRIKGRNAFLLSLANAFLDDFGPHPNQIIDWKNQLLAGAADVFGGERHDPPIDVKPLHAKIGQQALEIDFLSGALDKAGMWSAKR